MRHTTATNPERTNSHKLGTKMYDEEWKLNSYYHLLPVQSVSFLEA